MKNTKSKPAKIIDIKPDQEQEGKAFGCSEIFTLDKRGRIIKKTWKREEIKNWQW